MFLGLLFSTTTKLQLKATALWEVQQFANFIMIHTLKIVSKSQMLHIKTTDKIITAQKY